MSEQKEQSPGLSRRDFIAAGGGLVVGAVAAAAGAPVLFPPSHRLDRWGPDAPVWNRVPVREFALTTAPPFHPVIRGTATHQRLRVQAAGTAEEAYIRLQWEDQRKDDQIRKITDFSDVAAVQFPRNRDPQTSPIMGSRDAPVNIWHWKASTGKAQNLVAEGPFTIVPAPAQDVEAVGQHKDGRWAVAFRRSRKPQDGGSVDLTGVKVIPVAFALWEGGNNEAGGLKAVTAEATQGRWVELKLTEVG